MKKTWHGNGSRTFFLLVHLLEGPKIYTLPCNWWEKKSKSIFWKRESFYLWRITKVKHKPFRPKDQKRQNWNREDQQKEAPSPPRKSGSVTNEWYLHDRGGGAGWQRAVGWNKQRLFIFSVSITTGNQKKGEGRGRKEGKSSTLLYSSTLPDHKDQKKERTKK